VPRAILRVQLQNGVVVYGVHLQSNLLKICRTGTEFCKTGKDDPIQPGALNLKNSAELLKETAKKLDLLNEEESVKNAYDKIMESICSTDQTPTPQNPGTKAVKEQTLERARAREAVAGAVKELAATDLGEKHLKTVFVGGDFNTPLFEDCKTGTKINEDFEPLEGCNTVQTPNACRTDGRTLDGFDDTYSILKSGLFDVSFKVLTEGLKRTYANEDFVDSPIDNVLISGQGSADKFEAIRLGTAENEKVYGSDHYPVLVQPQ
jgi:hypothetical protein